MKINFNLDMSLFFQLFQIIFISVNMKFVESQISACPSSLTSKFPTKSPSFTTFPTKPPDFTAFPTKSPAFTQFPTKSPNFTPFPTKSPSYTVNPTYSPNQVFSAAPTAILSRFPSCIPSMSPTEEPSSAEPSIVPSNIPSSIRTVKPTRLPTVPPTKNPSYFPTVIPTRVPSTSKPTSALTIRPSVKPTVIKSYSPTKVGATINPSFPVTFDPSPYPTNLILSHSPTVLPTVHPSSYPTFYPTFEPTNSPSEDPTSEPTNEPTDFPTFAPIPHPTIKPVNRGTTRAPRIPPTYHPTLFPSTEPSEEPSTYPSSFAPTLLPSSTSPSDNGDTNHPSAEPTIQPTSSPTIKLSRFPTVRPTFEPSNEPTVDPTRTPTDFPTSLPSLRPTRIPSSIRTLKPTTSKPSKSKVPTFIPSAVVSDEPTDEPTSYLTQYPTSQSNEPTMDFPTFEPSINHITIGLVVYQELKGVSISDYQLNTTAFIEVLKVTIAFCSGEIPISDITEFNVNSSPYAYAESFTSPHKLRNSLTSGQVYLNYFIVDSTVNSSYLNATLFKSISSNLFDTKLHEVASTYPLMSALQLAESGYIHTSYSSNFLLLPTASPTVALVTSSSSSSTSTGTIAGAVVGSVLGAFVIIAAVLYFLYFHSKNSKVSKADDNEVEGSVNFENLFRNEGTDFGSNDNAPSPLPVDSNTDVSNKHHQSTLDGESRELEASSDSKVPDNASESLSPYPVNEMNIQSDRLNIEESNNGEVNGKETSEVDNCEHVSIQNESVKDVSDHTADNLMSDFIGSPTDDNADQILESVQSNPMEDDNEKITQPQPIESPIITDDSEPSQDAVADTMISEHESSAVDQCQSQDPVFDVNNENISVEVTDTQSQHTSDLTNQLDENDLATEESIDNLKESSAADDNFATNESISTQPDSTEESMSIQHTVSDNLQHQQLTEVENESGNVELSTHKSTSEDDYSQELDQQQLSETKYNDEMDKSTSEVDNPQELDQQQLNELNKSDKVEMDNATIEVDQCKEIDPQQLNEVGNQCDSSELGAAVDNSQEQPPIPEISENSAQLESAADESAPDIFIANEFDFSKIDQLMPEIRESGDEYDSKSIEMTEFSSTDQPNQEED